MKARISQRTPAALAAGCLALSSTGCSFLFHTGAGVEPDKVEATMDLDCTTHPVFPIFDTLNATGNAINIGMIASETGIYERSPINKEAAIGLNLAFMALYGASAFWGFHEMSQCRAAHERREELLAERGRRPPSGDAAADEGAPQPAPGDVVGFVFGASTEEAAEACRAAGYHWNDAEGEFSCGGTPTGALEGASARLEFEEGRLAVVELVIKPPDKAPAWARAFRETEVALTRLYGKPQHRSFKVPRECAEVEAFLGCVADGRVAGSATWSPGSGRSVVLSIAGAPAPSTVRVRFAASREET